MKRAGIKINENRLNIFKISEEDICEIIEMDIKCQNGFWNFNSIVKRCCKVLILC